MGDIKQVVHQLRALAAEPENREYILQDRTCFRGIVKFLDSSDLDVVHTALEIVQYLCCLEKNCTALVHVINNSRQQMAKEAELVSCLKRLMVDFSLPTNSKKIAGNVYATLQKHLPDRVPMYAAASENSSNVLREATNTSSSGHFGPTSGTGLSIFSEKVTSSLANAKTYTLYIKSLNNDVTRAQLESKLLSIKGVVSFSLDITSHRAVIRAGLASNELIVTLKSAGITDATIFPSEKDISQIDLQEKENLNEPQYLPEPTQASGSSWFSSIVSWGYSSVDERKEQQRRKQQKPTLLTKLKSVGEVFGW